EQGGEFAHGAVFSNRRAARIPQRSRGSVRSSSPLPRREFPNLPGSRARRAASPRRESARRTVRARTDCRRKERCPPRTASRRAGARTRGTRRAGPANALAARLAALSAVARPVRPGRPRRTGAAALLEALEQDAREALQKTLAKEDVASLLNEMAPADRTMF